MKLTHEGSKQPKIGDDLEFLFNKRDDKQAFMLTKDGEIWLSFETSPSEKLTLLRVLLKKWLE